MLHGYNMKRGLNLRRESVACHPPVADDMPVKRAFPVVVQCFCFDFKKFEQKINFKNVVFVLQSSLLALCSGFCLWYHNYVFIRMLFSCLFIVDFFNGVV